MEDIKCRYLLSCCYSYKSFLNKNNWKIKINEFIGICYDELYPKIIFISSNSSKIYLNDKKKVAFIDDDF